MTWATNNGREDSPGSVISGKASFAHPRTIVNDKSSNILVTHFKIFFQIFFFQIFFSNIFLKNIFSNNFFQIIFFQIIFFQNTKKNITSSLDDF
jgi:hypothetical protein